MASTGENGPKRDSHTDERFKESDLRDALKAIVCKGDFASLQAVQRCDPEIFVQDVGQILLPLSEAQARQLIDKSHQAPFGKGSDTIVDTSVRNTWELNPSQFDFRGASWQSELDAMLCIVRDQLGITAPITAELYKMLIYEKGAMFKAHTDTEKIPGMFGTLVISLPSSHEGGDVVVKHCGVEKTLQTSKEDMSCLFWYSDVSHEVLPLTAGYRWVLTYNLAIDPAAELPTADGLLENQDLRRALESWSRDVESGSMAPTPRHWILTHKYTEANISYQGLKTVDRECVRYLQKMCGELDFDLFLATLEKEESGPCEKDSAHLYDGAEPYGEQVVEAQCYSHELEYVCNEYYRSKYIFDLSGNQLAANMPLDGYNNILDGGFGGEPDQEDYGEYMGNWGIETTHWYMLSALTIVPCKGTVSSLATNSDYGCSHVAKSSDVQKLCEFFVTKHRNAPESKQPLLQLYELLLANYTDHSFKCKTALTGDCLLKVLQVSIHGNEPRLLDLMLFHNQQRPPIEFFAWIKKEYDNSVISIGDFEKLLIYAMNIRPTICEDLEAIFAVNEDTETTGELHDLIYRTMDGCMEKYREWDLQEEEGSALFDFSLDHRDFDYLKEVVIPIVEEHSIDTAFAIDFLDSLHGSGKIGEIPQVEAKLLYERVARKVLLELDPKSLKDPPRKRATIYQHRYSPPKAKQLSVTNYISLNSMLNFMATLISSELQDHLELFSEKMRSQAERIEGKELDEFWVPLLEGLFVILKYYKLSPSARHWTQIYQSVFRAYLLNYVKKLPPKPSLVRHYISCPCGDCTSMRRFLYDSNRRVGHFAVSEERRQHLLRHLCDYSHVDCEQKTDRRRNPHTLTVVKTTTKYDAYADAWEKRREWAAGQLEVFDQDMLRTVLADQYDDIVSMKPIMPIASAPPSSEQQAAGQQASPSVETETRPAAPNYASIPHGMPIKRPARYSWEELPPKRSMLEVSQRISETADRLRVRRGLKPRNAGPSRPSQSGRGNANSTTLPRPTAAMMGTNRDAGVKREHGEVETIDLTGDY
ncbi:hypothetical protein F4820DRAFT_85370 [Hypoxylon rubiginosum]|uniref:Uncharacterized protein n=1 Tax=Hypoxylon rubiginosum TaxID=110542 RepID=A0ACB9YP64_9PEZI|nr:hypothetical protein F4820DRAFT_85370 [Hypoxylon rubiginosum]